MYVYACPFLYTHTNVYISIIIAFPATQMMLVYVLELNTAVGVLGSLRAIVLDFLKSPCFLHFHLPRHRTPLLAPICLFWHRFAHWQPGFQPSTRFASSSSATALTGTGTESWHHSCLAGKSRHPSQWPEQGRWPLGAGCGLLKSLPDGQSPERTLGHYAASLSGLAIVVPRQSGLRVVWGVWLVTQLIRCLLRCPWMVFW